MGLRMEPAQSPPFLVVDVGDVGDTVTLGEDEVHQCALPTDFSLPRGLARGVRVGWEPPEASRQAQDASADAPRPPVAAKPPAGGTRWGKRWWPSSPARWKQRAPSPGGGVAAGAASGGVASGGVATERRADGASDDVWWATPPDPVVGWERPFRGFLSELRELQTRHEQRVLELLDTHQRRLDIALAGLRIGAAGSMPSHVQSSPVARISGGSRGAGVRSKAPGGAASASGPPPLGGLHSSATCARSVSRLKEEASPASAARSSGRTERSSVTTTGGARFSVSSVSEESSASSSADDGAKAKAAVAAEMRRSVRTVTWNHEKGVEDTELYRKKKTVERIQRRIQSAKVEFLDKTFSKTALAIVCHPRFELFLACVIILNAASIGVQADWNVQHVGGGTPIPLKVIDYAFTCMFTVELVTRLLAEGRHFMSTKNRNIGWNCLDTFLVVSAIGGDVAGMFVTWGANMSVIRLLRVLRLARAIRLIRVLRFFKDLRVMITGIWQSAKSLLWASLLLMLIIYMYAICVMQVVSDHLEALHNEATISADPNVGDLRKLYGSLWLTVYTLFGSISGGYDWAGVVEPLLEIHPIMGFLNMVYIGFAVFCVLNVITGVFVENSFKSSNDDDDKAILEMLESRRQWIQEIKDLFKFADKSNTGYVDWAEFSAIINDVRVQAIFRRLGLDVEADSATMLFQLLDFGGTGLISLDDFAEGIQRVRGNARSIDICQLMFDNRALKRQISDIARMMDLMVACQPAVATFDETLHEV